MNTETTYADFADEVFTRSEQMLRSELEGADSLDDAVAQVFRDRHDISDDLCSKYPAGPQSAIELAVSMFVTIDQLRETANEMLQNGPAPKRILPVSSEPYFSADQMPW